MNLRKEVLFTTLGWTVGARFSPGWLLFEVAWETSPPGFFLTLPFFCFWTERAETDHRVDPWKWGWSALRLTIWKTEFRLDLDLNVWGVGFTCAEFDDIGIYLGPANIQIETDKMYDVAFPPSVRTRRLFFPADRAVQPWPPGCDCGPPDPILPTQNGQCDFRSIDRAC